MLPCPECLSRGKRWVRIGANRRTCATCNSFAQHIHKRTRLRLIEAHREEYLRYRDEAEAEHYPAVLAKWEAEVGLNRTVAIPSTDTRLAQDAVMDELTSLADLLGVKVDDLRSPEVGS